MRTATTDAETGQVATAPSDGFIHAPVVHTLEWCITGLEAFMQKPVGAEIKSPPIVIGEDQMVLRIVLTRYPPDNQLYFLGHLDRASLRRPPTAAERAREAENASETDDDDEDDGPNGPNMLLMKAGRTAGGGRYEVRIRLQSVASNGVVGTEYMLRTRQPIDLGYCQFWRNAHYVQNDRATVIVQVWHFASSPSLAAQAAPCHRLVSRQVGALLRDPQHADVKLRCTDGKELLAHKAILCARSSMLQSMLASGFQEKHGATIDMKLTGPIAEAVLEHIYLGTTAWASKLESWESAVELYEAAEYYELLDLAKRVVPLVGAQLTLDNIFATYALAHRHAHARRPQTSPPPKALEVPKPLDAPDLPAASTAATFGDRMPKPIDAPNLPAASTAAISGDREAKVRPGQIIAETGDRRRPGQVAAVAPDAKSRDENANEDGSSGDLMMVLVRRFFIRNMEAIYERALKVVAIPDAKSDGNLLNGVQMMLIMSQLKKMNAHPKRRPKHRPCPVQNRDDNNLNRHNHHHDGLAPPVQLLRGPPPPPMDRTS